MFVEIFFKGPPDKPPFSFFVELIKLSRLLLVVFVSMIADILFFFASSAISEMQLSSISGETFNKRGTFVFLSFFILLREDKSSFRFF